MTLFPTDSWVTPGDPHSSRMTETSDGYCNLATILLAKTVNFLADSRRDDVHALWRDFQSWYRARPLHLLPILRTNPTRANPFPTTLYAGNSPNCANSFYHTGCMLLLRTGRVHSAEYNTKHDPIWHAKELCGISMSNNSHTCRINQVYPLYIAGEVFGGVSGQENAEEHPAEKFAILKLLAQIERDAGWPTAGRASSLRKLWGLE